jgi:hypothetical protein
MPQLYPPSQAPPAEHHEHTRDITMPSSISAPLPTIEPWSTRAAADPDRDVARARHAARFHLVCSLALTSILLSWLIGRDGLPMRDPQLGAALTVLHLGAWITAWLAFEAGLTTYRLTPDASAPPHQRALYLIGTCAALLALHTAMIVASVLP